MTLLQLQKMLVLKMQEKYPMNIRGLKAAFSVYDLDGNGLLDLQEMQKGIGMFLNGVKEEDVKSLVEAYDVNGDGKLSYEELLGLLQNSRWLEKVNQPSSKLNKESLNKNAKASNASLPAAQKKRSGIQDLNVEYDIYGNDIREARANAAARFPPPPAPVVASGSRGAPRRASSDQVSSVWSFNEDAQSIQESAIDLSNPEELESRARAYLNSLRAFLNEQALQLRKQGKAGDLRERLIHSGSDLLADASRALLKKAFQPFTGADDGRTRSMNSNKYLDFPEFTKALRSFRIPGISGNAGLRVEVLRFLYSLCHPDDSAELGADPDILASLLFGAEQPSARELVTASMLQGKNKAAGVRTTSSEAAAGILQLNGLSMVERAEQGKQLVGKGPVKQASGKDQHANEVPLRFTSRRSRTTFPLPAQFDAEVGQALSSRVPSYDLGLQHVHGLACKLNSGNVLLSLPSDACGNPSGQRSDPDFLDASVVVYAAGALGVVHDLSTNTQKHFNEHEHEITCLALSDCRRYVATGSSGARKSCIHVWESRPANQFGYTGAAPTSLAKIGEGFFERAVCSVSFLGDANFVCGIGCDDAHTLGIWDLRSPGAPLVSQTTQNGIPPQIKCMQWAPHQEFTEYITKTQSGPCDVGCTAGEHHLRLWSFRRPVLSNLGTQEVAQLSSRGAIFGTEISKQVQPPKIYQCVDFSLCADKTSDVVAGGSNGIVYLFRKGLCIAFQNAIKGGVRCLQVTGDVICCGGKAGVVACLNARTLAVLQTFRAAYPVPVTRSLSSSVQASGRAVSTIARPVSASSGQQKKVGLASDGDLGDIVGLTMVTSARSTRALVASTCGRTMVVDISNVTTSTSARRAASATDETAVMPSENVSTLFYFHVGELWGLSTACAHAHAPSAVPSVSRKVTLIATVADDRMLIVWDPAKRSTVARTALPAAARCVSFSVSAKFITVGTSSGSVHVFAMHPSSNVPTKAATGGKGDAIAASTRWAREQVEQRRSKKYTLTELSYRRDFRERVSDVKFSPDQLKIAAGSEDDTICIYSCEYGNDESTPTCPLRPLHRLRGHSSYITHLDWSKDSQILRSSCGAYELLYWNVETGKQHVGPTADLAMQTAHCPLGFPVMGIWPAYSDGTDINAVDVCSLGSATSPDELVATGDDFALISIMNYPCVVKHAPRKEYRGHGSHVTNLRFYRSYASRESEGLACVASTGGRDAALILWDVQAAQPKPAVRKYTQKLN